MFEERNGEIGNFFSHGTNHGKRTLILVKPKITCKVKNKFVTNGRHIILDLVHRDRRIALVNVYAPNEVNPQVSFFKELQEQH